LATLAKPSLSGSLTLGWGLRCDLLKAGDAGRPPERMSPARRARQREKPAASDQRLLLELKREMWSRRCRADLAPSPPRRSPPAARRSPAPSTHLCRARGADPARDHTADGPGAARRCQVDLHLSHLPCVVHGAAPAPERDPGLAHERAERGKLGARANASCARTRESGTFFAWLSYRVRNGSRLVTGEVDGGVSCRSAATRVPITVALRVSWVFDSPSSRAPRRFELG
jgi:hypothetical protein